MSEINIEEIVIRCIRENLEYSDEPVPAITGDTKPSCDLAGFDSLRTIEVLMNIEEKLGHEIHAEKLLFNNNYEEITVSMLARAIEDAIKESTQ